MSEWTFIPLGIFLSELGIQQRDNSKSKLEIETRSRNWHTIEISKFLAKIEINKDVILTSKIFVLQANYIGLLYFRLLTKNMDFSKKIQALRTIPILTKKSKFPIIVVFLKIDINGYIFTWKIYFSNQCKNMYFSFFVFQFFITLII